MDTQEQAQREFGLDDHTSASSNGNGRRKLTHQSEQRKHQTRSEQLHPEEPAPVFKNLEDAQDWATTYCASTQENYRYIQLLADQQAKAKLAAKSWTPPAQLDSNELGVHHPDWLIADYIERGDVGLTVGICGSAKSFLTLDWGCCVATGKNWFGHRVRPANVVYVAAEGQRGVGKRAKAWTIDNSQDIDKGSLTIISGAVPLASETATGWLEDQLREHQADLLIIDTIARSINGLNENDAADMGQVIEVMYRLRDARGEAMTAVTGIHHSGWTNQTRSRGSSRFESNVDFVHLLEKNDQTGIFTLTGKKSKEDRPPKPRHFSLRPIEVVPARDGRDAITSCVLQPASVPVWETPPNADADTQVLLHVRDNPGQSTGTIADTLKRNEKNISSALNRLKRQTLLREEKHGTTKAWYTA